MRMERRFYLRWSRKCRWAGEFVKDGGTAGRRDGGTAGQELGATQEQTKVTALIGYARAPTDVPPYRRNAPTAPSRVEPLVPLLRRPWRDSIRSACVAATCRMMRSGCTPRAGLPPGRFRRELSSRHPGA